MSTRFIETKRNPSNGVHCGLVEQNLGHLFCRQLSGRVWGRGFAPILESKAATDLANWIHYRWPVCPYGLHGLPRQA